MRLRTFIAISAFFSSTGAHATFSPTIDPNKLTVCSATIKSPDELNTMKKNLGTKDFQYVELTDFGRDPLKPKPAPKPNVEANDDEPGPSGVAADWFDTACKSGIKCDIVIVSGHFTGSFFNDDDDLTLTQEVLRKHSCAADCKGILSNPLEVFLFGCNTLAGKDADSRTPAEYLQVLEDHAHLDRATASQIVESRYSESGAANRDLMEMNFSGVPHIYGFKSTALLGTDMAPLLDNYFKKNPNYAEHLDQERIKPMVNALSSPNKPGDNPSIARFLGGHFEQCSGLDPAEPNYQVAKDLCFVSDKTVLPEKRLARLANLSSQKNFLTYFPTARDFFTENPPDTFTSPEAKALIASIGSSTGKDRILELAGKDALLPDLRWSYISFAINVKWLEPKDAEALQKQTLSNLMTMPMTQDHVNQICDMKLLNCLIKKSDLPAAIFTDVNGLNALGCMKISDPDFDQELRNVTLKSANSEVLERGIYRLADQAYTPENAKTLFDLTSNPLVNLSALSALESMKLPTDVSNSYANKLLDRYLAAPTGDGSGLFWTIRTLGKDDPVFRARVDTGFTSSDRNSIVFAVDAYAQWVITPETAASVAKLIASRDKEIQKEAMNCLESHNSAKFTEANAVVTALSIDPKIDLAIRTELKDYLKNLSPSAP